MGWARGSVRRHAGGKCNRVGGRVGNRRVPTHSLHERPADRPAPTPPPCLPPPPPATVTALDAGEGPDRSHFTVSYPFGFRELVACAAGGAGEVVFANGMFQEAFSIHVDASGTVHFRSRGQLQGFGGTGETTGATYRVSGGISVTDRSGASATGADASVLTRRERLHFVGTAGAESFLLHLVTRTTYVAGQAPSADVIVDRVECQ